ncbi:MAG: hypothetical protein GY757_30425 [bacterium]|nr:hypothetical protein [bacterium]
MIDSKCLKTLELTVHAKGFDKTQLFENSRMWDFQTALDIESTLHQNAHC